MAEPDPVRGYELGPGSMGAGLNLPEVEKAAAAVDAMAASMKGMEKALQDFGNNAYMMAEKINRHLKSIGDTATKVATQLGGVGAAAAGVGGGGGGTGKPPGSGNGPGTASSSSGGGGFSSWVSSASSAIASVMDKNIVGGISMGTFLGSSDDFMKDMAMAPLRYMRSRINTNRDTALMASGGLNMVRAQQGTTSSSIMDSLSKFPGSIYGTPQDLISMFGAAPKLGASFNFASPGTQGGPGQGVRASGFLRGIREMQMMNPMAQVGGEGGLVSQLGEYAGNTKSQQQAMMFTGGAMGMITTGGRQKSLSEWAESILRWFEGMRPGNKRGKGFNHGELMAQYFPGSNIDAWFNVNGVPQNMRDYWWTYALGKVSKSPADLTTAANYQIGAEESNVAWNRLKAGSELTRTEFSLAGQMSGQYANREQANRWFNELIGQVQTTVIPAISKGPFAWLQMLPDSIEDLMMTGVERGMGELFGDVPNHSGDTGDIGDTGYGELGGTGLGGLHPDVRSKVAKMMKANPRVRITSGLRDTGLQERLKGKGHSRVSGKPSAHTRGLAADLGPRSEYNWIAKNARKFGLASGIGHGEPWHVGMKGDVGDPGSDVGDIFDIVKGGIGKISDFKDILTSFDASPTGMAKGITGMLGLLTGLLSSLTGSGSTQEGGWINQFTGGYDSKLYGKLYDASKDTQIGIPVGGGSSSSGGSGGGSSLQGREAALGGGSTFGSKTPASEIAAFNSPNDLTRGAAVVRALNAAGFKGNELQEMAAIAWWESRWTPSSWVQDSDDIGGGLFAINKKPYLDKGMPVPWTDEEIRDPYRSAEIAYNDFYKTRGYKPWTTRDKPLDMGIKARNAAGVGDIEGIGGIDIGDTPTYNLMAAPMVGGAGSASNVNFHNTFNLSVPGYGGGSNGGIDVRRTVNLIADHLEGEMKKRMARSA